MERSLNINKPEHIVKLLVEVAQHAYSSQGAVSVDIKHENSETVKAAIRKQRRRACSIADLEILHSFQLIIPEYNLIELMDSVKQDMYTSWIRKELPKPQESSGLSELTLMKAPSIQPKPDILSRLLATDDAHAGLV
jgi:hypothetical protein